MGFSGEVEDYSWRIATEDEIQEGKILREVALEEFQARV
jgi:hypothetical protein